MNILKAKQLVFWIQLLIKVFICCKNAYFHFSFGVCCLFLVTSTGATINQNCTYIRNPNFPSVYSSTSSLTYTIHKCSSGNLAELKHRCFDWIVSNTLVCSKNHSVLLVLIFTTVVLCLMWSWLMLSFS